MPFEMGREKSGGRQLGTPNRATAEFKEFWQAFFESEEYRMSLKARVLAGKADHMEKYAAELLHGRPRQELDITKSEGIHVYINRDGNPIAIDALPAIEHSGKPEDLTGF
jgi:hypothetical protein